MVYFGSHLPEIYITKGNLALKPAELMKTGYKLFIMVLIYLRYT